ncbi:DUF2652 domain-containing protein [Flavobacterium sp. K5-23]|uniref:DUF2652 domain-containing protein n=1 Tax=Flavobacterium sp. K5-23 TaxID=2746225 RepID=UPI00200CA296|nr:DUF2652 domain-containing protein [Flavobacterium sp. K5-23]UQD56760.1 DUF2652 domain-containing protein [Flavobacterium sp. K5-23]
MQKALYFMPDISGFTRFVNNTELDHSIHIIAELLEILLDSNTIGLELIEIEGDALFMYTTKIPSYQELLDQIISMQEKFHTHTKSYEAKRVCNCGSCRTTTNLELKFVVHYGDLAFIKVKDIIKPYGKDVIKIHRLLKNDIPVSEYILYTKATYELYTKEIDSSWGMLTDDYDLGRLDYFYKNIENIKDSIPINTEDNQVITNSTPYITLEKTIEGNSNDIYAYISEFKYRHLWDKEVKRVEYDENKLNRSGSVHNCVLDFGHLKFETVTSHSSDSLTYGESTNDMMFMKNFSYLIKLHNIESSKTRLEVVLFFEFTTVGSFIKSYLMKMIEKIWSRKLNLLYEIGKIPIS